jgi:glycine/D-amino acid oxidase-like deaminating enzyme
MKTYDYIIVGAGIAGCSTAYFLSKYTDSILLIDRNSDLAQGASGAAGAFLSPLLGKPNKFKDLVTKALNFSTDFYLNNIPKEITNCGVVRIPKNKEDAQKFETYKPYMDFPYEKMEDGYYFKIGSQVNSYNICSYLADKVEKLFDYEVLATEQNSDFWIINGELKAKNLILTTGADISLIKEKYFNIRAVWGQKIDIYTSTQTTKNYHKECSVSHSTYIKKKNKYLVSIGATHHRINEDLHISNNCLDLKNRVFFTEERIKENTNRLLTLADDIIKLEDIEVCDVKIGPRASSVDYFPMVGKLIDSQTTIKQYPHLVNGSHVKDAMLSTYDNLYVLNGVGGRGFVLSSYLASSLVENIINNSSLDNQITTHRMFKRWVKKSK